MVGDRTAKTRLGVVKVMESQFADDVALYANSRTSMETVARKFVSGASEWGVTVSAEQMKDMVMGERLNEVAIAPVQVEGGEIEMVEHFIYRLSVVL